ncbi:hypothetical protein AM571_CH01422 [Rhizobium etli 8C-3]|uniref:Uncharacterized protein n=1 Tax=Rhizobium etli 8C-3 TaxID=538025 RepID=A0A1L5P2A3_RHIET|nr:hypothetical protein [Rhizobium etli]APO74257.1 hypothetical protein AM571_CH01422 [Rhizobium etli 8C-3]
MSVAAQTMSKGDFARHIGVTPGRISQYIAEGKICGDALDGEGRLAKIVPDVAKAQLRKTLEPGQRFGANGSASISAASVPSGDEASPPPAGIFIDPTQDELAQLRLRRERVKTEQAEREDQLEIGRYMLSIDARREMGKAVAEAFKVMELGLSEMAKELAEQFGIPQHDSHHALQKAFRNVRAKAAETFRQKQQETPEHVEDDAE